ncbi:phosphatidylinositol transporter [Moniliophthora roreri MCA 2997]|uniref:Phosphatidylinositol transporter n=2 Tax=Moniliophthora roreri TaxID=221103 RepID=V2XC23_MONRO|nr:phosphatidylinositol transporter [Moniliophthora roreri MCA 2997]KAI3611079.1 phosphatidylinositol transporter [Moniliophthora roreri]
MGDPPPHDDLAGHSGHLTASQEKDLLEFKESLSKAGLYSAGQGERKASHDDATLLRFLRARRWDVPKAQKQFVDTQEWRKKHDVDNLFATFDAEEFEDAKRFYPRWTGRRDKGGRPVYVYRLESIAPLQKELHAIPPERRLQRIIALYELMTNFSMPLCSHLPHDESSTPISSTTSIIDLESVSLSSMWGLRNHLQEASNLATANYPETLHAIAVVNSPSFFPTIWRWISSWFDEGTRRKIHVLGKGRDAGQVLQTMIAKEDLPIVYGGELDWKYENEPSLDDAVREAIGLMPKGPAVFVNGTVAAPGAAPA